jgi:hypothetical protein
LEFLNLEDGNLEIRARVFARKAINDVHWAFNSILKFMQLQKERFNRREIAAGTIRNYVKTIKLFCQMADIPIVWEEITRGLPRGKRLLMIELQLIRSERKVRWSMNSKQGARYIKRRMGDDLKNQILVRNGILSEEAALAEKRRRFLIVPDAV